MQSTELLPYQKSIQKILDDVDSGTEFIEIPRTRARRFTPYLMVIDDPESNEMVDKEKFDYWFRKLNLRQAY